MPLPDLWVKSIFARLSVRYGAAWTRMWEGIDMAAVQADWAEELAGFQAHPDAIAHGLDNLPPDRPPTVQQFAAACNRAPTPAPPALPAPVADPQRVAEIVHAMQPTVTAHDPVGWAKRLRSRELGCEHLTPYQRGAWREVLGAA